MIRAILVAMFVVISWGSSAVHARQEAAPLFHEQLELDPIGGLAVHGGRRCNLEGGRRMRGERRPDRECGGGERAPHLSTVQRETAEQIVRKLFFEDLQLRVLKITKSR